MLVAINRHVINKTGNFETLTTGYENLDLTQVQLASEINKGYAIASQHKGRRSSANFIASQFLGLDFDKDGSFNQVTSDPFIRDHYAIYYSTSSSTPENPRGRVLFELENPVTNPAEYTDMVLALLWKVGGKTDQYCKDPCRVFYGSKGSEPLYTGNVLPMAVISEVVSAWKASQKKAVKFEARQLAKITKYGQKALDEEVLKVQRALNGQRNVVLNKAAFNLGQLIGGNVLNRLDVETELDRAARATGLPEHEIKDTMKSGLDAGVKTPRYAPQGTPGAPGAGGDNNAGSNVPDPDPKGLPELRASKDTNLAEITDEAWAVLEASNNPPRIFKYGNVPCRLEVNDLGRLQPVELDNKALRNEMAKVANWYDFKKGGRVDAFPPLDVMTNMLVTPDYPLPVLKQIVETPVFDATGRLIETPGYDPASKFYYRPAPGLGDIPPIMGKPTPAEVDRAKTVIFDNLLCDFPFSTEADTAAAVSELLQPFCRDMLGRNTPLYLHEAPQAGTGKTLLAQVLLYPALGLVSFWSQPKDDDEMRKSIVAMLKSGSPALVLDNCGYPIDSAALAQVITTGSFAGRILGSSTNLETQVTATFLATANNPTMSAEIARRCVSIRLKSLIAAPWQRTGFKHSSLLEWVEANRADVCWAALTLIQNWIAAGRHQGAKKLGGFETWARTIGGILNSAGIPGFLDNLTTLYDQADEETNTLKSFLALWREKLGSEKVQAIDLLEIAQQTHMLDLGDGGQKSQMIRFGRYLHKIKDKKIPIEIDVFDKETGEVLPDIQEFKQVLPVRLRSKNGSATYQLRDLD